MTIHFGCGDCGAHVKVPVGSEGRRVKCLRCGHLQRVPSQQPQAPTTSDALVPPRGPSGEAVDPLAELAVAAAMAKVEPSKARERQSEQSVSVSRVPPKPPVPAVPQPEPNVATVQAPHDKASSDARAAKAPRAMPLSHHRQVHRPAGRLIDPVDQPGRLPQPSGPEPDAPAYVGLIVVSWTLRGMAAVGLVVSVAFAVFTGLFDLGLLVLIGGLIVSVMAWGLGEAISALRDIARNSAVRKPTTQKLGISDGE